MSVMQTFMEQMSETRTSIALVKPELQAAVDAATAWYAQAKLGFNSALPQPARDALTIEQKARLLFLVFREDYGDGDG